VTVDEMELIGRFGEVEPLPAEVVERAEDILRAAIASDAGHTRLAPRTGRSSRSRRSLTGIAAAAAVIAIAVVVVLTSTGQSASPAHLRTRGGHPARTVTPGGDRARVVDALSADTNTVLLVQSVMTTPGEATITGRAWYYPWDGQPGVVRQAGTSWVDGDPASKLEWDQSFTIPAGDSSRASCQPTLMPGGRLVMRSPIKATGITIDFSNDTWQPTVSRCFPLAPGLDAPAGLPSPSGRGPVSDIRTMISDGLLQVVGHRTLNGQPTIEFASTTHGILTLRLWVNASTYLPVQSVMTGPTGDPNPGKTWTEVDGYTFLSPRRSNLAHLRVGVPPGFTRAPPSSAQG
jgi:hypothetical protein